MRMPAIWISVPVFFVLISCSSLPSLPPDQDFQGIVALSNCSGSLVRFTTSKPDDKGLILTNGHCLEGALLKPGESLADRPSDRSFSLVGAGGTARRATLQASALIYATTSMTDMALYRLTESYAEIERSYGAQARTIAEQRAKAGASVKIISGYWHSKLPCTIDGFVHELKEQGLVWRDAIRYDAACDVIDGTSGAPIVDVISGEVVGISNTGNDGGVLCSLNNPCENDEASHVAAIRGRNYGQQTHWLYACLTSENRLKLDLPGCMLPAPR